MTPAEADALEDEQWSACVRVMNRELAAMAAAAKRR
jgi:hypothetical protein